MASDDFFSGYAAELPVLAIFRGFGRDKTIALCERAWDIGIGLVEIPVQSPDALSALTEVARLAEGRGAVVGAGTVTSVDLVKASADAGAAFTVAPGTDIEVAQASIDLGMPHIPGVGTATEVHRALQAGMVWQKAFPAAQLGAGWMKALHGPFPEVRFCATGGVDIDTAEAFLDGGAEIIALGSALTDDEQFKRLPALVEKLKERRAAIPVHA